MNIERTVTITLSDAEVLAAIAAYIENSTPHVINDPNDIEVVIKGDTGLVSASVVIK